MTGVDSWSITPATNATADGGSINWAEGQAPSTVNNTARQMCADIRSAFNDLAWFQYGSGDQNTGTHLALPGVYASATSWTYAGVDVTAAFTTGRRVRAVGATTGIIYGKVSSSSFSTNTTVNATWDSGSLSNETLTISLSQAPVTGDPVHPDGVAWSLTNDSATAGSIGESNTGSVLVGSAVSLTTATPANITSMSLTAGDWDVSGNISFTGGATTLVMELDGGISTTSATLPTTGSLGRGQNSYGTAGMAIFAQNNVGLNPGPIRISLASTTTVYLVANANFTTSTCSAYGTIQARRSR